MAWTLRRDTARAKQGKAHAAHPAHLHRGLPYQVSELTRSPPWLLQTTAPRAPPRSIAARLRHVAAAGLRLVTTQALATTSAPILARLGFVTVAEIASYAR